MYIKQLFYSIGLLSNYINNIYYKPNNPRNAIAKDWRSLGNDLEKIFKKLGDNNNGKK